MRIALPALLIIGALGLSGILFTNMTKIPKFDEVSLTCKGSTDEGQAVGKKVVSTTPSDCTLVSAYSFSEQAQLVPLKGVDLINPVIELKEARDWEMTATSLFNPKINETKFLGTRVSNSHWLDAEVNQAQFIDSNFVKSQWEKSRFYKTRFDRIAFSGSMKSSDLSGSKIRGSNFAGTHFEDVSFSGAEVLGTDFTSAEVCGSFNVSSVYFSRSPIALKIASSCARQSNLDFSNANLRFGSVMIDSSEKQMKVSFDGADLRGADLSSLKMSSGQWSFRGARVDDQTQLPKNFMFISEIVREKTVAGVRK